jgi:hypothetical protein
MFCRFALFAAIAALAFSGAPVHAEPLKPIQAHKVQLGTLTGVAYYTVEPDGHHLVLTLQTSESETPFRVIATLAPGQDFTLSVPRGAGEPAVDVHFTRANEQIFVNGGSAIAHVN